LLGGLRAQELLIILLIVLLVFGARKLPDLARSLGASAKEFRKGIADGSETESDVPASDTQNPDS
jgi:sec-independent protein translocase protein TatA